MVVATHSSILSGLQVKVLLSPVLRSTTFRWTLSRFMRVTVKISMETNMKNLTQQHLAVNVSCKQHLIYAGSKYFQNIFYLDTHAICLRPLKVASSSCGTPQSQITVVIIVMVLFTKLTQSLTPSTMKINVRQQRLRSAGFCQVCSKNINIRDNLTMTGYHKAQEESTFSYKDCCNDETGIHFQKKCQILNSKFKGLSRVNTTKFEPKVCSQRKCYYSENIIHSIWILSQVNLKHKHKILTIQASKQQIKLVF